MVPPEIETFVKLVFLTNSNAWTNETEQGAGARHWGERPGSRADTVPLLPRSSLEAAWASARMVKQRSGFVKRSVEKLFGLPRDAAPWPPTTSSRLPRFAVS